MDAYKKHIELLGFAAQDKITNFEGVIDSVSFDLYGCIQVLLQPKMNDNGEIPAGRWFDVTRVNIISQERIVTMPDFYEGYVADGKKGPADKPINR